MHCIRPIRAGFAPDGSLTYNTKNFSKELVGTAFGCRKCLPCRLNLAREKSIRALHEADQFENNIFLTTTYNEENLFSSKLVYPDWQNFMKSLRDQIGYSDDRKISYMVTGEYGELNKRPHWHALLFNYAPPDAEFKYTTELGEKVFTSEFLSDLWGKGNLEFGSVTLESAGYVARYAAKKLVHGLDQDHEYHPIHKTSSKRAIGRSWIEKNYKFTFQNGFVVLPNGSITNIPRYYVDWAKEHQYEYWKYYVTEVRPKIHNRINLLKRQEELEYFSDLANRQWGAPHPPTRSKVKETILKLKFKRLQERLKL